jgi:hypothetical protein
MGLDGKMVEPERRWDKTKSNESSKEGFKDFLELRSEKLMN